MRKITAFIVFKKRQVFQAVIWYLIWAAVLWVVAAVATLIDRGQISPKPPCSIK